MGHLASSDAVGELDHRPRNSKRPVHNNNIAYTARNAVQKKLQPFSLRCPLHIYLSTGTQFKPAFDEVGLVQ